MIRRFVLCAAASLILSATAFGQGKVMSVYVSAEDNQVSKDVADMFRGKVGSTLRYSLVNDLVSARITVDILCVSATHGTACTSIVTYYPVASKGLSAMLTPQIALGPNDYVTQSLFDSFVTSSSDEQLLQAERILKVSTDSFWATGHAAGFADAHESCNGKLPKKN
jgi:hypothetical protein